MNKDRFSPPQAPEKNDPVDRAPKKVSADEVSLNKDRFSPPQAPKKTRFS